MVECDTNIIVTDKNIIRMRIYCTVPASTLKKLGKPRNLSR